MMVSRRCFTAAATLVGLASSSSLFGKMATTQSIPLGVHTFSFHQIREGGLTAVDEIVASTKQLGLSSVELFEPQLRPFVMPEGYYKRWWVAAHPTDKDATAPSTPPSPESRQAQREQLRQWRLHPPEGYFAEVRRRFARGGIEIYAYNLSFDATMTDDEIDAGFEQAKILGAKIITSSSTLSQAKRLALFAEKHRTLVAFHNTTSDDPDRLVTPEAFKNVLDMSHWYRINLDVAHFFAAGYDPVSVIDQQHQHIASLHLHDRKGHNGVSVPIGEGGTPLREVLALLRDRHWPIPSFYELEHVGSGLPISEIERDLRSIRALEI